MNNFIIITQIVLYVLFCISIIITSILILDLNECEVDNFGCEHKCFNTRGSAKCGCHEGYQLSEDGKNCTGMSS